MRRSEGLLGYLRFKIIAFNRVDTFFKAIIASSIKQLTMRLGFVFLFFTTSCIFSLAQVVPDTTHINIGDKTIIVIDANPTEPRAQTNTEVTETPGISDGQTKRELTHFAGIDFGFCQLIDASGSLTRDSSTNWLSINNNKSLSWRFNLIEHKFRIYRDYIGIYSGFAIAYNSYGLARNADIVVDKEGTGVSAIDVPEETRNYTKNKLRNTILQAPIMLEFNTRSEIKKNFHFAAGIIGGWVTSSISKQKWQNETGKFTSRRKENFLVSPYTLDFSVRIGYQKSAIFFTYGMTPLFEKNQGKLIYPVTFGIQLTQF